MKHYKVTFKQKGKIAEGLAIVEESINPDLELAKEEEISIARAQAIRNFTCKESDIISVLEKNN